MDHIDIRPLTTVAELQLIPELERKVWDMAPIPIHQTFTAVGNGGIILGAFKEEKIIGFLYSFAGFDGEQTYLCSHMLGILPEYQIRGLGMKMKLKQAELAKEYGYSMITWTFDPLESKNAYLNIHKLGAVGAVYSPDHYGDLQDGLNTGLPTDRIKIKWDLSDSKEVDISTPPLIQSHILLDVNKDDHPFVTERFTKHELDKEKVWLVAIPQDFQTMKKENMELAKEWRFQTRDVMQALFASGYQAKDVIRNLEKQVSYYVFKK